MTDTLLKNTLLVLLLANLICFAWWAFGHAPTPEPPLAELRVKNIRLLAEMPAPKPREQGTQPGSPLQTPDSAVDIADITLDIVQSPPEVEETSQACLAAGPFDDFAAVDAIKTRIVSNGGRAKVLSEQIVGSPDYLVYIGPTGSRGTARRMLQELKGQALDCHIITDGVLANALSLGVFTDRRRAEAQRQRVAELGYEVNLRSLSRTHTVYRLLAHSTDSAESELLQGLEGAAPVPCAQLGAGGEDVASDERIL
ncbi:MAG: SPOR domain-containing protein [Gammaproteobacteria bacterium]|nr:SPOR domain-containing protein [Gammaproteobacteria bacterium]